MNVYSITLKLVIVALSVKRRALIYCVCITLNAASSVLYHRLLYHADIRKYAQLNNKAYCGPYNQCCRFRTSPTTNSLHVVLNYTRLFLDFGLLLFYV
jgi:hypothetical protein